MSNLFYAQADGEYEQPKFHLPVAIVFDRSDSTEDIENLLHDSACNLL